MPTALENALQAWATTGSALASTKVIWAQQDAPRPAAPYIALRVVRLRQIGQDWYDAIDNTLSLPDDDIEAVDDTTDSFTLTAHVYETGDGPVTAITTDTLPAGLEEDTNYFVIVLDPDTVQLAATLADALAGTPVSISDAGTGTHTLVTEINAHRVGEEIIQQVRGTRIGTLQLTAFAGVGEDVSSAVTRLDRVLLAATLPSVRDALNTAKIGLGTSQPVRSIDGVVNSVHFEPRAVLEIDFHTTGELSEFAGFIESATIENLDTGSVVEVP